METTGGTRRRVEALAGIFLVLLLAPPCPARTVCVSDVKAASRSCKVLLRLKHLDGPVRKNARRACRTMARDAKDRCSTIADAGATLLSSPAVGSVITDKIDYFPGQVVTILGNGWLPGETVDLVITRIPAVQPPVALSVTADADGNFTNTDFSPTSEDVGIAFVLVATGLSSGEVAQWLFWDSDDTPAPPSCPD